MDGNIKIPEGKKTVLGLYVKAKEAYEIWKTEPDKVKIIDVRTPEEIMFVGHPVMAWQIPVAIQLYEWNSEKGKYPMELLADFASRVKMIAKPDDTLMLMCRSGGRSAIAINILAKEGYSNVYQIIDGFEGDIIEDQENVFIGKRMMNGWKNAGCPWSYELDREKLLVSESQQ